MELKEIVAVSGKGGLFKVVKPTRTGMILESLDEQKVRLVAGAHHRLSLLTDISVYTNTADGSTPLQDVLYTLRETYGTEALPVGGKSEPAELVAFMEKAVPDYASDRVYASDIKKLVTWYGILREQAPEILERKAETAGESAEQPEAATAEPAAEKPKAGKKKKEPKEA